MPKCIVRHTEKWLERNGYLRLTKTGRLVIDLCPSDAAHMDAPTLPGDERRRCMSDVVDLLVDERFLGHVCHVKLHIALDFREPIEVELTEEEICGIPIEHVERLACSDHDPKADDCSCSYCKPSADADGSN